MLHARPFFQLGFSLSFIQINDYQGQGLQTFVRGKAIGDEAWKGMVFGLGRHEVYLDLALSLKCSW